MWANSLPHFLANGLAVVFAIAAMIDLAGFRYGGVRLHQVRHPRQFYWVMGVLQLMTAIFLATPQLRVWGILLAALVTFFGVVTWLNRRQWSWAVAGIMVMLTLVPASLAIH